MDADIAEGIDTALVRKVSQLEAEKADLQARAEAAETALREAEEALRIAVGDLTLAAARLRALGHGQAADTTAERSLVAEATLKRSCTTSTERGAG